MKIIIYRTKNNVQHNVIHIALPLASRIMAERDRGVYGDTITNILLPKITTYCQQDKI